MRLAWMLLVLAGCHHASTAAAPDAGAPPTAAPSNAPKALRKADSAILVEVRETSDADGRRGDVAFKLTRARERFGWDGKGVPYPDSLGERVPDPDDRRTCSCDVTAVCPRCDGFQSSQLQRRNGVVSAAVVDAFIAEVMRHGWAPGADAGAPRFSRHLEKVHVAIAVPGVPDPIHVSIMDSRHRWLLDDRPIGGDTTKLDAAYQALSKALGIGDWLAAMSPPVETSLPPDFADLAKAAIVEVHDSWNGLGSTHDDVVRLKRQGKAFAWRAKIASYPGSLGESTPNPFTPKERDNPTCTCDVDATCPCEHPGGAITRKKGTVPAAAVEAFLRTVAAHTIDPAPPTARAHWTDDYPKAHVVVWVTPTSTPIHLGFPDQQRQWHANGLVLSPDPAPPAAEQQRGVPQTQHQVINASYQVMLTALGEPHWVDESRR